MSPKLLKDALQAIPCVLVEETGKRKAKSPKELSETKELWTIDCDLLSSAESLIREVASTASLSKLVNALNVTDFKFPNVPVVCGVSGRNELVQTVFERKEVDKIIVNPEQRRVDLHWVEKATPSRWIQLPDKYIRLAYDIFHERGNRYGVRGRQLILPQVPNDGVAADVPSGEIAVMAFEVTYLVPGTEIAAFARQCVENVQNESSNELGLVAIAVLDIISNQINERRALIDVESVRKLMRGYDQFADHLQLSKRVEDLFDFTEFSSLLMRTNWKTYDPSVWRRRYEKGGEFKF